MPSNSANPALGTLQKPLIVAGINITAVVCECAKGVTYKRVDKIPVADWIKCCILGRKLSGSNVSAETTRPEREHRFMNREPTMSPLPCGLSLALLLSPACGGNGPVLENVDATSSSTTNTTMMSSTDTSFAVDEGSSSESSSSTTGPMPCVSDEDCTDADAPFCGTTGECGTCDTTLEPDGACAGVDAMAPLCLGGACVACTAENTLVCDQQQLLCDDASNACVPCDEHEQCESGACELAVGTCFPPDAVVHVDGDGGADYLSVVAAVADVADGAFAVIVVHEQDSGLGYPGALINGGKTVALLAATGESPILQGTGGNPGLRVEGVGTTVYMDGLELSLAAMSAAGLRVNGALAWVDRSRIVQNSGGGIVTEAGADLTLRNCFVGGDVSDTFAMTINGSIASVLYTTVGAGFGAATALGCDGVATVDVRNSLFVARSSEDEVQCSGASIEHSAAEMGLGGTNIALGDMSTTWFLGYGTGDFHLTTAPVVVGTTAQWETGDPPTDIDGDLRPTTDGASDFAGADVP